MSVRPHRDDGSAIVEFVYLAVLMMIPLTYLLLTVFRIQAASFAVASASREAGRIYVTSPSVDDASARAAASAALVMRDSDMELDPGQIAFDCASECLAPGSRVEVAVGYDVSLPLVPAFVRDIVPTTVHVEAHHVEVVDRFREGPQ